MAFRGGGDSWGRAWAGVVGMVLLLAAGAALSARAAGLPNAWQIVDATNTSGSLHYTNTLTAAQKNAATNNGWHFTVVSRLVAGSGTAGGNTPAQFITYGHGNRRFIVGWDTNAAGQLSAILYGGPNLITNLTTAAEAATNYHRHELIYDPATTSATYLFDGASIRTWAGLSPDANYNGQALFGAAASGGRGTMNYHQVQFAINGLGTVSEYHAGFEGNPATAPSPTNQGWTRTWSVPASTTVTNFPVSPDSVALPDLVITTANDSGAGSLRNTIASATAGATITFAPALNGQIIVLTSGELAITKDLTILGPGANQLAISGNGSSRVFSISPGVTCTLAGLTVTNGNGAGGLSGLGGGILNRSTLIVSNSTLSGNVAASGGGGIYNLENSTLTVQNSTLSGNSASQGGGIHNRGGMLTVQNSTLSGNSADFGGGIYNFTNFATLVIENSTVTGNRATIYAGGIRADFGLEQLSYSLVAGNFSGNGTAPSDIGGLVDSAAYTLIGSTNDLQGIIHGVNGNIVGNNGGSPLAITSILDTNLLFNGGPTRTHALVPGSPALNANPNAADLPLYDQRGPGFPRVLGGAVDIGAFEWQPTASVLITCPADVVTNVPNGTDTRAVSWTTSASGDPAPTVVCLPPSGSLFSVGTTLVTCTASNVNGTSTCTFSVTVCATNLTVTSTSDGGPGSLRQALANVCRGGTIQFDPTLSGQSIVLTSGPLVLGTNVTILGPGPASLAINGSGLSRLFQINPGVTSVLAGLTLTNGHAIGAGAAADGGAISHSGLSLTISNCTIAGNLADNNGGALSVNSATARVTVQGGVLHGNAARNGGAAYNLGALEIHSCTLSSNSTRLGSLLGGGIYNNGLMTLNNSVLTGNSANYGGAIYNVGANGKVTLTNTTLNGNTALVGHGGGIYNASSARLIAHASTIHDNTAKISGGGIYNASTLGLTNLTLSGNRSTNGGAIYNLNGSLDIHHSTLCSNVAGAGGGIFHSSSAATLRIGHTLLARGAAGVNFTNDTKSSTVINVGFNLSDDSSTTNRFAPMVASLALGPLAQNGGPTRTHALLGGSPAIDAGTNAAIASLPYDQRGYPYLRREGLQVDVGAFERATGDVRVNPPGGSVPPGTVWPGRNSVAWGDYDNDGRLDFLFTGNGPSGPSSQLWQNTASGFSNVTSQVAPGLTNLYFSSVAWADYDNDGNLDLLVTGSFSAPQEFPRGLAQLWRNTGQGLSNVTAEVAPNLPGVLDSSVAWGDWNNDGRQDFLLTGRSGNTPLAQLWLNTAAGFTNVTGQFAPDLPGVSAGSVAWADYDRDGRLDFLLTGQSAIGPVAQLWRNLGDGFSNVTSQAAAGLPPVASSAVAWADYDNDGRLDFLLTGQAGTGRISQLWRQTDSGFSNVTSQVAPGLPGVSLGAIAWGDLNNDGRTDFVLTGSTNGSTSGGISQLWQRQGDGFVNATSELAPALRAVSYSAVAWADPANRGRLDLLISGSDRTNYVGWQFWNNDAADFNTPPAAPELLNAELHGNSVTLRWLPPADDRTPPDGLSYNLVLGTSAGAIDLAAPMAEMGTGFRRIAQSGLIHGRTSWTFTNLPPAANYYWSVQAIDSALAGGPFAGGQPVIPPPSDLIVTSLDDSGPGSLRDAIASSPAGGTIVIDPALAGETLVLTSGELVIDRNLTILGPEIPPLAISGNGSSRVFVIHPGVTNLIAGLTLLAGWADSLDPNASNCGGAIWNQGFLTVSNCTISDSLAAYGGGICNGGVAGGQASLTLYGSTLNGNEANTGGAIYNHGSGSVASLAIVNSTLSGNTADFAAAIANDGRMAGLATLSLGHSTLQGNSAALGDGIENHADSIPAGTATVAMSHTLLAKGTTGANVANFGGAVSSQGFNLSDDASCASFFGPSDLVTADVMLGPLLNNGGPTFTHALLSGSPALNAGNPAYADPALPYDQRGPSYRRVAIGRIDIGAYEDQLTTAMLHFVSIEQTAQGVRLRVQGPPDQFVQIEWTASLDLNALDWQPLALDITDTDGNGEFLDPDAPAVGTRFYRAIRP